jgi:Putative peptidoglycan binding domain
MATIGIDIASLDGNGTPDWDAARREGHLRFVGLRAAEGLTSDLWYPTYRHQLDAIDVPNFPYLLMTPNLATPEAQVRKALDVVGTLNKRYFPLALDVEGPRRGFTAVQWLDWVIRAKRVIEETLGVPPLLYSSRAYWIDPDGMNNLPAPELTNCLGWWKMWTHPVESDAIYDPIAVDELAPPPTPPPWHGAWGIHQFQGDAINYPGFRSTVDMNRVHVQRQGDTGESVKWIQHRLPGLVGDGIFGPKTRAAVETFQAAKKITTDGVVGLDTTQLLAWEPPRAINSASPPRSTTDE